MLSLPEALHDSAGPGFLRQQSTITLSESELRSPPSRPPEVGMVLGGRFRLMRELGHGATGTVFEAADIKMADRRVAVKALRRVGPQAIYRFKREFRAAAELAHPNLVAIHELLVEDGERLCLVMDKVDGEDVVSALRRRDPDCGELTRDALAQIVFGTQALHEAGIVHCDLKPSNVLLSESGRVCIIDFGLARAWREVSEADRGVFRGTPAYAAPEQFSGGLVTPAADWFAVGVMLYEVLSGSRPFSRTFPNAASEPSDATLSLPEARSALRARLGEVCGRLLSSAASERADGWDLLRALDVKRPVGARRALSRPRRPFGRDAELSRLNAALDRVLAGVPAAVLLRGEAGVGKTFLAEYFVEHAVSTRGAQVLRGRCLAHEMIAYKAVDGLMDALSERLERAPGEWRDEVSADDLVALGALFPALLKALPLAAGARSIAGTGGERRPSDADDGRDALRARAVGALRTLLTRLSSAHPLVLFIDDLHWGDLDSASLLLDLFAGPRPPPVFLLATYRPVDSDAPSMVSVLLHHPSAVLLAEHVDLGPLAHADSVALVQSFGFDESRARRLAGEALGNPRRLRELVQDQGRTPGAEAPSNDALRWAALSDAERGILRILVAAGRPVRHELLARMDAGTSHGALRRLRLSRWVRETIVRGALHLEPYDPRGAEGLLCPVGERDRRDIHGRLADAALELGESHMDAAVEHLTLAGRVEEAVGPAVSAARLAERSFAFHHQAELLVLALRYAAETERRALRVACAAAYARAGNTVLAAQHYELAALESAAEDAFDLRCRAVSLYFLGGRARRGLVLASGLKSELKLTSLGFRDRAPRSLVSFLKLHFVPPAVPPRDRRVDDAGAERTLRFLVSLALATGRAQATLAARCWLQALQLAQRAGDRQTYVQAFCSLSNASVMTLGRPFPGSVELLERELSVPDAPEGHRVFLRFLRGMRLLFSGTQRAALDDLLAVAAYSGDASTLTLAARSYARVISLPALFFLGRIQRLGELSNRWLVEAERAGNLQDQVDLRCFGAFRLLQQDDVSRAREEMRHAHSIPLDIDQGVFMDPWWEAWACLYDGDPNGALEACHRSRRRWQGANWKILNHRAAYWFVVGSAWAELAASGRAPVGTALKKLERARNRLARTRAHRHSPLALQLSGTQAFLEGRSEEAVFALRAALFRYEDLGHRMFAACVRLRLASLRGREDREASEYFRQEGIVNPRRWAGMLAPGFDGRT